MTSRSATIFVLVALGCGDAPLDPVVTPPCDAPALELEVGTAALLPAADSSCWKLAPGGLYAVAFFDTRLVELAESRAEEPLPFPDTFSVRATLLPDVRSGAPSPVRARVPAGAVGGDTPTHVTAGVLICDAPAPPHCRDAPWRSGDELDVRVVIGDSPVRSRIQAVVGPLALAVPIDEASALAPFVPRAEAMLSDVLATTAPLLARTFGPDFVHTSPGSGQLLVVLHVGSLSFVDSRAVDGESRAYVVWSVNPSVGDLPPGAAGARRVLDHELTHVWQLGYKYGQRPEWPLTPWVPRWGLEGGADLVANELLRTALGLPLDPELPPTSAGVLATPEAVLAYHLTGGRGRIPVGYFETEPLLRDLLLRAVDAGASYEVALTAVSRGAVDGWWGVDATGNPPLGGLVPRVRELLGSGWEPVSGVFTWVLSNALDERTGSVTYRNPSIREAWRGKGSSGFAPDGEIHSAGTLETGRRSGGAGYLYVDSSTPSFLAVRSDAGAGVRWMVARAR